jgi:ribA/ribD-fused uncharacterized protein
MISVFDGEYAFLSNFYMHSIEEDGITYPSNEHYFQAMKTLNRHERLFIAAAETPGKAKRRGRQTALRADWESVKDEVMLNALRLKFADPILGQKLLDTEDAELIEGNHWCDNVWGNCYCAKCANITGQNRLGQMLMRVRDELRNN